LDIAEAIFFFNNIQEGVGYRFKEDLKKEIAFLRKHPEIIQKRHHDLRISFLKKFPFGIHFLLDENAVRVIAIFHTSRDPKRWKIE
jgi:plasmid stabilization system protein ParE